MMCRFAFVLGALAAVCMSAGATGSSDQAGFPASTLENAFEYGCSLVLADIESVRQDGAMYTYVVKIARVIVAGDLEMEETQRPLELFAGTSYGDALKSGSCYAMFITRDCPYLFSWAFRDDAIEIDPSGRGAVRWLIEVADRVYAKTSIRQFRRGKVWSNRGLPPLPDELAALCREFRNKPGRRTDIGKKIFESDLGSRLNRSNPFSSTRVYLPPKILCSRQDMLSLLGYPTWKNGWTYSWTCDHSVSARQGGERIGVLSTVFDQNDKAIRVLYGMHERSKWIRPSRIADRLAKLDGNPADVASGFQKALKASDWPRALSYCSQAVQAKAREMDSTEDFFRRFVPVGEIVSEPFQPSMSSSGRGGVVRVTDFIHLPAGPNDIDRSVRWSWTLARIDRAWGVDFELVSLDLFIEKERVKRQFRDRPSAAGLEEFKRAIRYVLVPLADEFVLGRPMLFRLEMRNVGNKPLGYPRMPVMVSDPMLVIDPNGRTLPYVDTSYQIGVGLDAILPGETIVLEDQYDVTSQYRILEPGGYTFQWKSHDRASNVCEVDVKPGPLPQAEVVFGKVLAALPAGWSSTRRLVLPDRYGPGPQAGLCISLIGKPGGKGNDYGVDLLIAMERNPVGVDPWLKERYDFWGLSPWGLVYARVGEVESLWPNCRADIAEALEITDADR